MKDPTFKELQEDLKITEEEKKTLLTIPLGEQNPYTDGLKPEKIRNYTDFLDEAIDQHSIDITSLQIAITNRTLLFDLRWDDDLVPGEYEYTE